MSIGYGGRARIVMQDNDTVIYEYAPYDLNEPGYRNSEKIFDGLITISKQAFVAAEIHTKVKRMPSGRKIQVAKRIRKDIDYEKLLETHAITVENSKYCWRTMKAGCGMIALKLVFHLFDYYQEYGTIPETMSIHY